MLWSLTMLEPFNKAPCQRTFKKPPTIHSHEQSRTTGTVQDGHIFSAQKHHIVPVPHRQRTNVFQVMLIHYRTELVTKIQCQSPYSNKPFWVDYDPKLSKQKSLKPAQFAKTAWSMTFRQIKWLAGTSLDIYIYNNNICQGLGDVFTSSKREKWRLIHEEPGSYTCETILVIISNVEDVGTSQSKLDTSTIRLSDKQMSH